MARLIANDVLDDSATEIEQHTDNLTGVDVGTRQSLLAKDSTQVVKKDEPT